MVVTVMVPPSNVLTVEYVALIPQAFHVVQPYLWAAFTVYLTAQTFCIQSLKTYNVSAKVSFSMMLTYLNFTKYLDFKDLN